MSDDSCNSTKHKNVISKYFTKGGDESLEDFQETKKIVHCPKTKPETVKKARKTKKIDGQKDIRSALKRKKNELIEFTKEFNNVCEKTGIDVDSEQLQLAVALSKSLQTEAVVTNTQKSQTSQERNRKIRATLQEYGFVVPEIKITTSRRIKKPKNHYKLISVSDAEKKQIISEKYSQVLFEEIKYQEQIYFNTVNCNLYHLTTSVLYEDIKSNDLFYVGNLLEKSTSAFNLLRDWNEIPGRPASPKIERVTTDISAIEFTQNELDTLMSGTLKSRDDILANINIKEDIEDTKNTEITKLHEYNTENMTQQRCYSPDIFEDESTLIETSRHSKIVTQETDIYMDLTECVNHVTKLNLESLSQKNMTRRKSDDFMDMTECVSSSKTIVNKIDLTVNNVINENIEQVVDKCEDKNKNNDDTIIIDVEEYSKVFKTSKTEDFLDLTQENSPKTNQSFFDDFHHDHSDSKENNAVVSHHDLENLREDSSMEKDLGMDSQNLDNEEIDLTQSSDTSVRNDVEFDNLNSELNTSKNNSFSVANVNEISEINHDEVDLDFNVASTSENTSKDEITMNYKEIDLTQSSNSPKAEISNPRSSTLGKIDNVSIDYDDIIDIENNIYTEKENSSKSKEILETELSQNSEIFEINDNELDYSLNKSRFDTINKDSFRYDLDDIIEVKDNESPDKSDKNDDFVFNKEILPTTPQKDTLSSTNKSPERIISTKVTETPKNDDFIIKFDTVTPMQDYASMTSPERNKELYKYGLKPLKRKRAIQLLTHLYNQTHPLIEELPNDIIPSPSKKRKINLKKTPLKNSENFHDKNMSPKSPKTKSPSKNKDLNKSSPSKRHKNSPKANLQNESPTNVINRDSYEISSEVPVLKEVVCNSDDWVFQKREKAKVHTCRVPLHIAFHNYVSSRNVLREAILKYEPVNIDVIHKELVGYGHRYDPKDLLKFLDKKCITVKTTDNNARNTKY